MIENKMGVEASINNGQTPINELGSEGLGKLASGIDKLAVNQKLDQEEMFDLVFGSEV